MVSMMVLLADFYIRIGSFLFFGLVGHCDINAVGVVLGGLVIFGLQTGLAEQTLDVFDASLQLDTFEVDLFESL